MGNHPTSSPPQQIYQTPFGLININILKLHIDQVQSNLDKKGKFFSAKLMMGNQNQLYSNILPFSFKNLNFSSQFSVNNRHLPEGRTLMIQVFQKGTIIANSSIGTGVLDLDYLLKEKQLQNLKIYLNKKNAKIGWVQIKASFLPYETNVLTVMFDNVSLRSRSIFGSMKLKIRTQIGQQMMQTSTLQDKIDQPANWRGEMFTFYYLKGYNKEAHITIYDDDKILGSMTVNIEKAQQALEPEIIKEKFNLQGQFTGKLKLIISKGEKTQLSSFLARPAVINKLKKYFIEDAALSPQENIKKTRKSLSPANRK